MTTLPSPFPDYSDKDFGSLNLRLENLIKAVYPQWTDFNRASFGNLFKEMVAFVGGILTYYQDQQAKETRWGTAVKRSSIISLAKLISYELSGATPATVDLAITLQRSVSPGGAVTIPAGTFFRTTETVGYKRFQTLSTLVIPAGSSSGSVSAENSETFSATFVARGEGNEEFVLAKTPFIDGTATVMIDGFLWEGVDNFLDSGPTDKHYQIAVDQNDRATIKLGDGINGAIASNGSSVVVSYKVGGGVSGNVEAGSITRFESGSWLDANGSPVYISSTNTFAASGGTDRETIAEARENAPRSLRVLNRTVTREDFEDNAVKVAGIARALMLTKTEYSGVGEIAKLYVIPDGGGVPSGALKSDVLDYITESFPPLLCFPWEVSDPYYIEINVRATIYMEEGVDQSLLITDIRDALKGYFAIKNDDGSTNYLVNFGYYYQDSTGEPDPQLPLSDIVNIINDVDGVRRLGTPIDDEWVELNDVAGNVTFNLWEFPIAGDLILIDGDSDIEIYNGSIV